ncbi:hypothetical protein [Burkholderia stagnalis]
MRAHPPGGRAGGMRRAARRIASMRENRGHAPDLKRLGAATPFIRTLQPIEIC